MKRIIVFCIFVLSVSSACFSQSNETETITFTTYFASPGGVYKNFQLSPSEQPEVSGPQWAGVMYFNETEQIPYIYNGTEWLKIGSDEAPTVYLFKISPEKCSGQLSLAPFKDQLCSVPWHLNITFAEPFSKPPHVIVFLERASDWNLTPCAQNTTDQFIAYPELIDEKGFRLTAAGSPDNQDPSEPNGYCKDATHNYQGWYTRAAVSCLVISE
jgi:hypothetical protein